MHRAITKQDQPRHLGLYYVLYINQSQEFRAEGGELYPGA